jgi:hypothetical protein
MRTYFASTVLVLGVLDIAACAGSKLDPGAGNDPGTGTGTLTLTGTARATSQTVNAKLDTDFNTDFSVRVSLNNQTVTTGTVTITSASGKVPLTYRADTFWTGTAATYDEVYILDVVSGPDKAEGIRVDGPDIHTFSAPTEGASLDSTMPNLIKWNRRDTADSAELRAESINTITIPDSGSYSLAAGSLKADQAVARQNTLRLSRSNNVVPKGTTGDSSWKVTIENELDVVANPLP